MLEPTPCPAWEDSLLMRAARRQRVPRTPVWLMRQAGRYMAEYREIRAKVGFLELCRSPELSAEVMLTAVDRLGVDAAIIFSDILPILQPMGIDLEYAHGEGPVIHNPVRNAEQVEAIRELEDLAPLEFVFETVRKTRAGLGEHLPVIGFAGAPFTLASYAIEGGGSRNYLHAKRMMLADAGLWHALLGRLARTIGRYLIAQIDAGAQLVQIFDSWVGCLGPDAYREMVLPHTRTVIEMVASAHPRAPVIHFGTGNPILLPLFREAGGDVVGVDWRVRLDDAWEAIGHDRAVQGNIDPAVLLTDPETIRGHVRQVLDQAAGRPGHIFNLGHGVHKETPVENAIAMIEAVKDLSTRRDDA